MIRMKVSWVVVLLCALPVAAQMPGAATPKAADQQPAIEAPSEAGPRRVVAPCTLVEASIGPSAEESPTEGAGYGIHIINNTNMTLDFPSYPEFGWRVETLQGTHWKLKAKGGPVQKIGSPSDPHMAIVGPTGSGPMVHIAPTFFRDYRFFLKGANEAMRREGSGRTTFRLTVYWAASSAMKQADPAVPNCALTAEWIVKIGP